MKNNVIKKCPFCNKEFIVNLNNKRQRNKKTCGDQSCRSKLSMQNKKEKRICIYCKEIFFTINTSNRQKCDKCRKKALTTCKYCKKIKPIRKGSKFCSKSCSINYNKQFKKEIKCFYCGKKFLKSKIYIFKNKNHFCSDICKNTYYNKKYKRSSLRYGDQWWDKRLLALERDGYKCLICESENNLQVHHFTKLKNFKNPNDAHYLNNLGTFCKKCHYKIEKKTDIINSYDKFINNYKKDIV